MGGGWAKKESRDGEEVVQVANVPAAIEGSCVLLVALLHGMQTDW